MKILIIGGGKLPSEKLLRKEYSQSDYTICADKGGEYLLDINLVPHMLIGDFDSISEESLKKFSEKRVLIQRYPVEKDYTDTEICVMEALEHNPDEIVMLGCTGSRLDHVIGNIGLLKRCLDKNVKAYIKDENNVIFLMDKPDTFTGEKDKIISLQAFTEEVSGLNISGVKYPLKGYNLKSWSAYTVSNVMINKKIDISFEKGILMVIFSKD
ncbi:thiamine diphosphokinase [Clostridium amylolyticum]|uniref:Thiamine diphosphokinase n=1 Tax=Clostridium amylolyticum TaxID=1121298 RepID=A0A1M6D6D0_9CLOT|nr:thiamine diphosphokinase [Clostridium amylolyticum]SHI68703.1 thiamine diphosphokinase [Clostridium amylolyticum]